MGRPTLYTPELADEICSRLAEGESLNSICKTDGMPNEATVRSWAINAEHPFSTKYVRARELGYLRMADELLDIADDGTNDYVTRQNKDGSEYEAVDHDHIARSRLRVDTRKWLLSKCLPKIYGERITNEVVGKDGGPIQTEDIGERTSDDFARRVALLLSGYASKANGHSAAN